MDLSDLLILPWVILFAILAALWSGDDEEETSETSTYNEETERLVGQAPYFRGVPQFLQ